MSHSLVLHRFLSRQPDGVLAMLWRRIHGCWIHRLCDDTLCHILSFLDALGATWNSIPVVCKRWKHLAQLPRGRGFYLGQEEREPTTRLFRLCARQVKIRPNNPNPNRILEWNPRAYELFLWQLNWAPSTPEIGQRIRRLTTSSSFNPDAMLLHLPSLTSLNLYVDDRTPVCQVSHEGLKSIRFTLCSQGHLPSLFPHVPFPRCTHLSYSLFVPRRGYLEMNVLDTRVIYIDYKNIPALSSLSLRGPWQVAVDTSRLSHVKVTVLDTLPCQDTWPWNLSSLVYNTTTAGPLDPTQFVCLCHLAIDWGTVREAMMDPNVEWPSLRKLVLCDVTDGTLVYKTVAKRFPSLRELRMGYLGGSAVSEQDCSRWLTFHGRLDGLYALMVKDFCIVNPEDMPNLFPRLQVLYASLSTHRRLPMGPAWCPAHASTFRDGFKTTPEDLSSRVT